MKKFCLIVSAAALVCACTADLKDRVDSLEKRVDALETKVNSNAEGISALVAAAEKAITITSVETTTDGYIIHFSDKTTAAVSNGKDGINGSDGKDGADGKDGRDGVTPVIGVAEVDGVYYWTVNGEFLLAGGEKVPVSGKDGSDGKDGVTPQFKIEDGVWYVTTDGTVWAPVPVSGTEVPQLNMEETENEYVFTYGETVIRIAKEKAFSIKVDTTDLEVLAGEKSVSLHYTLTGADDSTVVLAESDELGVKVDAVNCNVNVTIPSGASQGHILLRAIRNSDSRYAAQYITFSVNYYGTFGGTILVSDDDYLNW